MYVAIFSKSFTDQVSYNYLTVNVFQAEFRHFWLNSKLEETVGLSTQSKLNQYPILSLPNIFCNGNLTNFLQNLSPSLPLDGILFYHREGFYMNGRSPLVTWLKPFMMSEVLGISVPFELDEKPDGYIDFRQYILSKNCRKKNSDDLKEFLVIRLL